MTEGKKPEIYFILNTLGLTGGVKVVFEHANLLVKKGYKIKIVHLLQINKNFKGLITAILKKIKYTFFSVRRIDWFNLEESINIVRTIKLTSLNIPKDGIIVATANETADFVNELQHEIENKFYFVQDYELWTRDQKSVEATYHYQLQKITSATWLNKLLKETYHEESYGPVHSGVEYQKFFYNGLKVASDKKTILMLYHVIPKKGAKEGLAALEIVKKHNPNVNIILFGAYQNPNNKIVDEFYFKPNQEELVRLYQSAHIFLCPSWQEGFTLPPMEAMAAQCALVGTEVGGITDYGINDVTALVVPIGRVDLMAQSMIKLLDNEEERQKIALAGQKHIKDFSWESANDILEKILIKNSHLQCPNFQ